MTCRGRSACSGTAGETGPPTFSAEHPHLDKQWDYQEHKKQMEDRGVEVADLVELGRSVLAGLRDGKFIIELDTESSGELMAERAERIGPG